MSDLPIYSDVSPAHALGAVRLTLGRGTTALDVERAGGALIRAFRALAS